MLAVIIFMAILVSCEEVCSTKNLAWAPAAKIRLSPQRRKGRKEKKISELGFLAPWHENIESDKKFASRKLSKMTMPGYPPEDHFNIAQKCRAFVAISLMQSGLLRFCAGARNY
jgi:hypothetical protein